MKRKLKRNPVPVPYRKWLTSKEWKQIPEDRRKAMTDLIKLQNQLRKHFKNNQPEEYVNMNAEIEYLKSIGEH